MQADANREDQRRFWNERYREDPTFFGERESAFARWSLQWLRESPRVQILLELGCGYGRDLRFFHAQGYEVHGLDVSEEAVRLARNVTAREAPRYVVERGGALDQLSRTPVGSVDVVYSNLFLNMNFREDEHHTLFRAIASVLRPEGRHLYSVRSTSDPWYGRGRPVGPDTFDPSPDGVTMHFFSPTYSRRLSEDLFLPLALEEHAQGAGEFPIQLLYVADQKR